MRACVGTASLIVVVVQIALAGCAATIPVEVTPEVTRHDQPEQAANTLVTVGPRRLLGLLAKQISAVAPKLEIIDPLLFRDTAFPEGGWQLQKLLEPAQRSNIIQSLQIDYLVLLSPLVYKVGDADGFFVPLVAGVQYAEHKSSLSATIYDLISGTALCRIDVTSSGNESVLYYVVVFAGTTPQVVTPTLEALAKETARAIENAATKSRARIAILAAE